MHVQEVVRVLETVAPPELAADWDNVGLLVGDRASEVSKLLLCIDLTEAVLAEAARTKAEMVLAYHPVIFKPVSHVTAADAPIIYAAAKRGLAVYCPHTALDAAPGGTNDVLADVLGLAEPRPLEPIRRSGQCKIVMFIPPIELSSVAEAAFAAGAGSIGNYRDCAFFSHGIGTFCAGEGAQPTIGNIGRHEATEEIRLEIVSPMSKAAEVCDAVRAAHSYEEAAIDVYPLEDFPTGCGMGRIGRLGRSVSAQTLIGRVKKATGLKKLFVAAPGGRGKTSSPAPKVSIAACCAGSCGSLVNVAVAGGATFYLTGEMRHHDALAAAAEGLTIVCTGHSHSERITLPHLARRLGKMLPGLKTAVSKKDADPFEIV